MNLKLLTIGTIAITTGLFIAIRYYKDNKDNKDNKEKINLYIK